MHQEPEQIVSMKRLQAHSRRQRGAALVVGLLLLLVITLLAVAGMNSVSSEMIMTGNEQYHQKAFQAAETGIAQAIAVGPFVPGLPPQVQGPVPVPNTNSDNYTTTIASDIGGACRPMSSGNSVGTFGAVDYTITSTGTSVRNSTATHVQGLAQIVPGSGC